MTAEIITSKSGKKLLALNINGRSYPLESTVDPERSAKRLAEKIRGNSFVVFVGAGSGYHIKVFSEKSQDFAVVEAFESVRDAVISVFPELSSKFIRSDKIYEELKSRVDFFRHRTFEVIVHPQESRILPEMKSVADEVRREFDFLVNEFLTVVKHSKRWLINGINNVKVSRKVCDVSQISGLLNRRIPAVVVSAGPSLADFLTPLCAVQNSSFVLATDTSFPVLMKSGIVPDLVVSIDPQNLSVMHFAGFDIGKFAFVLDPLSPSELWRKAGLVFSYTYDNPVVRALWNGVLETEIDVSSGSVSGVAVQVAEILQPSQIFIVGLDLSWGKTAYPSGSFFNRWSLKKGNRLRTAENVFYSMSLRGDSAFDVQKRWFARFFERVEVCRNAVPEKGEIGKPEIGECKEGFLGVDNLEERVKMAEEVLSPYLEERKKLFG